MPVDRRKVATLGLSSPAQRLCIATLGILCEISSPGTGPFTGETLCPDVVIETAPTLDASASPPGTVASAAPTVDGSAEGGVDGASSTNPAGASSSGGITGSTLDGGSTGETCT